MDTVRTCCSAANGCRIGDGKVSLESRLPKSTTCVKCKTNDEYLHRVMNAHAWHMISLTKTCDGNFKDSGQHDCTFKHDRTIGWLLAS